MCVCVMEDKSLNGIALCINMRDIDYAMRNDIMIYEVYIFKEDIFIQNQHLTLLEVLTQNTLHNYTDRQKKQTNNNTYRHILTYFNLNCYVQDLKLHHT